MTFRLALGFWQNVYSGIVLEIAFGTMAHFVLVSMKVHWSKRVKVAKTIVSALMGKVWKK